MNRKLISVLLILAFCFCLVLGVSADTGTDIYDEAALLTDGEEARLAEKLGDIGQAYDVQLVIVTVPSTEGADIDWYLESLYDGMGFGCGANYDGVLLLVCMDIREYRILSNGYAGVAIDTGDIGRIGNAIESDLSDGDYAAAFEEFADQCAYYLEGYRNGFPFNFGRNLVISLVIGLVAGIAVALVLKGQLKSVRKQNRANNYVKADSMRLTVHRDLFLYRNVTRTRKESNNSSQGSGSSRSTGGGKF